jgi:5-methylcytosine-specific restriction endonuclease McrA
MSTPEAKRIYNDRRWPGTRQRAFERDGYRCRYCKRELSHPTAHHKPEIEVLLAKGLDPFDEQYVYTACRHCHGIEDGERAHPPKPAKVNRFAPWL